MFKKLKTPIVNTCSTAVSPGMIAAKLALLSTLSTGPGLGMGNGTMGRMRACGTRKLRPFAPRDVSAIRTAISIVCRFPPPFARDDVQHLALRYGSVPTRTLSRLGSQRAAAPRFFVPVAFVSLPSCPPSSTEPGQFASLLRDSHPSSTLARVVPSASSPRHEPSFPFPPRLFAAASRLHVLHAFAHGLPDGALALFHPFRELHGVRLSCHVRTSQLPARPNHTDEVRRGSRTNRLPLVAPAPSSDGVPVRLWPRPPPSWDERKGWDRVNVLGSAWTTVW